MDPDMEKVLGELRRKRGVVKASLTRVRKFVEFFDSDTQAMSLLEFRQEELPQLNRRFDEVQCEIELICAEEAEAIDGERDKFEQDYYAIRSRIHELINSKKTSSTDGLNVSLDHNLFMQRAKLPPITLPSFDGRIEDWESFYDGFLAMVHDDRSLTSVQKFYYLRSSVSGVALDIIKAVPITDANYAVALERLKKRYDNRSLIIQSHIRALLDCPHVDVASANKLQELYSYVCTHVASLRALGQPVQHWDAWLVTIVLGRLDKATVHEWQLRQVNTEMPKFEELDAFLSSRCTAFESSEAWADKQSPRPCKRTNATSSAKKVTLAAVVVNKDKCNCCDEAHKLYLCPKFKELGMNQRLNLVREERLCFNCLSPYHVAQACKSARSCAHCKKRHNSLLHVESQPINSDQGSGKASETTENRKPSSTESAVSLAVSRAGSHIFLATALVLVTDKQGREHSCRAVLDNGSQVNLISRRLLNTLQVSTKSTELPVRGVGASSIESVAIADIHVSSRVKEYEIDLPCYVLPVIVNELPACTVPQEGWKIPKYYEENLADPTFFKAGSIDLLLGGGIFYDLLETKRVRLDISSLSLYDSKFGWLVVGEIPMTCLMSTVSVNDTMGEDWTALVKNEDDIYGRHSKSNRKIMEAQAALEHFLSTVKRESGGRFVLQLPLKHDVSELGDTLCMAKSRFFNVERKLQQDEALRIEYVTFMQEYLRMGHMQEIIEPTIPPRVCYLPHHAVIKTSSLTTKVRVVFDASAKGSTGKSLNDYLLCGPSIQEDVFTILCRFRKHLFVLTADVEKMYRQVSITETDCDLQRIVWRNSPSEQLRHYRLLTVTYGMASASFMATQCLSMLADEHEESSPKAAKAIRYDFYMDDLMTGSDTENDCLYLQREITSIMNSAQFPLRKWCSNSSYLREKIGEGHKDPLYALEIGDDEVVKSLGLCWRPVADEFRFRVCMNFKRDKLTKRIILSDLNRIFDPLGFLAPTLIKGKIFLQQLWQMKSNWDSTLPREIEQRWYSFYEELEELKTMSIARNTKSSSDFEVHGFCDASEEAYGACVYIRSRSSEGTWGVQMLCARSRVAPMRGSTIPRLELNGALVLAQLTNKVADAWNLNVRDCHLWTDSTVVLSWLNSQPGRLKVYVANRVNQILEMTNARQWNYVRTNENPADLISRGVKARDLVSSELWWRGPRWLSINNNLWTHSPKLTLSEHEIPEQRTIRLALICIEPSFDLVPRYSAWSRLLRAVAWLGRFIDYLKARKVVRGKYYLTVSDLKLAEERLLKRVQAEVFHEEIQMLKDDRELPSRSKLRCLLPFLRNGLILVGGRLQNANISESQKHPIVLPSSHAITRLIIKEIHLEQLHVGPSALLAAVRRKFWPLRGRALTRSVVLRCVRCTRARPRLNEPLMAALPMHRVQVSRPFTVTGVDFAGPLIIRSGARGVRGKKAWIAVFVCFTTRAVHLEAVEDMSSNAFVAALRRFISRRGYCSAIYSDNGTNFVGAQKELALYVDQAAPIMAQSGIEWHFNPPSAPHFGGLWESAVKSAKHHLTRVLNESKLTLGELTTLLCQVEACLNSRPITPISSNPTEPEALTPAHFLIGGPISLPPEPSVLEPPCILRRWKYVQYLTQSFWRRWQAEYLPQYHIRGKWTTKGPQLSIDNIVIIKDEGNPPTKWKLGKVVRVHPGKDGVIRVVTVRLASGAEMKRPAVKLCVLPTQADNEIVEK